MFDDIIIKLKQDNKKWEEIQDICVEKKIPAKTILLKEGEISEHIYLIKKGCLRLWFNNDGKDITFQFFFENQPVSSIESFLYGEPSIFEIESLEPSVICSIGKNDFKNHLEQYPEMKDSVLEHAINRFRKYLHLFLSMIKDTPQKRYENLLQNHPEIIKRVPQ